MKSVLTLLLFLNLALHSFLWAQSKRVLEINTLVITHVMVIDATGAPAKSDMSVVISGDRITALGKASQVRIHEGLRHIIQSSAIAMLADTAGACAGCFFKLLDLSRSYIPSVEPGRRAPS
jgi:hypothetical protein